MTIPVATTTVTTTRPVVTDDAYDDDTYTLIATGVRAVISEGSGFRSVGESNITGTETHRLTCDPTSLESGDLVTDSTTGTVFTVVWASPYTAPAGLSHTTAGLQVMTHG